MELKNGIKTFHAKSRKAWRAWLQKHHAVEKSLWLIIYRKGSETKSVYYNEAVEEALCFGWIDSKGNKRDEESFYLFMAKRNAKSNWSKLNKERVKKLTEAGLMKEAGQQMIDLAKKNGTWDALNEVDAITLPADLKKMFTKNKIASQNFNAFPPSAKRGILEWILNAKQPATRLKRLTETVEKASQNIRANQYKK